MRNVGLTLWSEAASRPDKPANISWTGGEEGDLAASDNYYLDKPSPRMQWIMDLIRERAPQLLEADDDNDD